MVDGLRWKVVAHFVNIGGIVAHHCLSVLFMFDGLRWKVDVRFVDIGRIVAHHCLNFLIFICKVKTVNTKPTITTLNNNLLNKHY